MDGAILRQRRQAVHLGQAALARAVGVSRSTVSHWETDRALPDAREIARIERTLREREAPGAGGKGAEREKERSRDLLDLDPADAGAAPKAGGVLVIHGEGRALWAGKAKSLRKKLARLAREPWFPQAVRATALVVRRKKAREGVAALARRLAGLA